MKKILFIIFALLPILAAAQSKYVVTGSKVNLRSAPSTKNSRIIGSLSGGQTITVKNIKNGWATITYNGKECYVNASYLKPAKDNDENQHSSNNYEKNKQKNNRTSVSNQQTTHSFEKSSNQKRNISSNSDKDSGFAMSSDIAFGYSNKIFSASLGFDAGFRVNKMLYFGAGPMLECDFSDGGSAFGAGGYGKIRFTIPTESIVKPMLGARIGYFYNFTSESGDIFYGGELGLHFAKHFYGGIMVTITSNTTRTTTKHTNTTNHREISGKITQRTWTTYSTEEDTKYNFTPALFFSVDF